MLERERERAMEEVSLQENFVPMKGEELERAERNLTMKRSVSTSNNSGGEVKTENQSRDIKHRRSEDKKRKGKSVTDVSSNGNDDGEESEEKMAKEKRKNENDDADTVEQEKACRVMAARHYTRSNQPRLRWNSDLHVRFLHAIARLGGQECATPKSILHVMNVKGLTIGHVKSHLQMYRSKRANEIEQGIWDFQLELMQIQKHRSQTWMAKAGHGNSKHIDPLQFAPLPSYNQCPSSGSVGRNVASRNLCAAYNGVQRILNGDQQRLKDPWFGSVRHPNLSYHISQINPSTASNNTDSLWASFHKKEKTIFHAANAKESEERKGSLQDLPWVNLSKPKIKSSTNNVRQMELFPLKNDECKEKKITCQLPDLELGVSLLSDPLDGRTGDDDRKGVAVQEAEKIPFLSLFTIPSSNTNSLVGAKGDDKEEVNLNLSISIKPPK